MTVNLSMLAGAGAQFFDNNGVPLAGGLVYTYTAGTTTPQASYTTSAGSIAHANPIVLDSAGRVPSGGEIWLTDAVAYKFVLKTSTSTTIGTYDNVTGNASGIYAAFAASSGSSLVGYIQSGASSVATTVQTKLRQNVSVMDFMTAAQIADVQAGTLTLDCTTAITSALNASTIAFFPQGNYLTSGITLNQNQKIYGFGSTLTLSSTTGTLIQCYNSSDALQTSQYSEVSGFVLVGGQTLTSGSVGVNCGQSARLILRDVRTQNFDVGFKMPLAQFGSAYSIKSYACNVGLYLKPSVSGGGSNSWSFYDYQGVGCFIAAILINNTSSYPQGAIYFRNPSLLGNAGVSYASFNAAAYMDGGSPEGNATATFPLTFDSITIQQSSMYLSNSQITITNFSCAEAAINPLIYAVSNSSVELSNGSGYGLPGAAFVSTDSTSIVNVNGSSSIVGYIQNLVAPPVLFGASNNGNMFVTPDNTFQSISFPNESTSPLTTDLSGAIGSVTSTTVWDATYGLVGNVVFAATGSQDSNRIFLSSLTNSSTTGAFVSGVSLYCAAGGTINIGFYGVSFSQLKVTLPAGKWVRVYNVAANTGVASPYVVIFAVGSVPVTVRVAKSMTFSSASINATTWQTINAILAGSYNPKVGAVHYGRKDSAIPTTGTWVVGDVVYNTTPASAGYIGWVCTVAGTPGTWKTFGLIS